MFVEPDSSPTVAVEWDTQLGAKTPNKWEASWENGKMETCKLHSQALPTALIQPLADPASSRPGHSWSRESWSGGKLISWELIWWQVDLVRVDLVPIDLVTPNWTVLPQFFKHLGMRLTNLGMRLTNLGMRLTWNEVQPGNKVREWKACFFN